MKREHGEDPFAGMRAPRPSPELRDRVLRSAARAAASADAGPTIWDRVLALNALGTKTVLLVAILGILGGRTDYLDIALLYALINFVATIAMLRLIRLEPEG